MSTYDGVLAAQLAPEIARHLSAMASGGRKYSYDRGIVKGFQRAAELAVDGIYGGETRGALLYFAPASNPPTPFFRPTRTVPYEPPLMAPPVPEVVPPPAVPLPKPKPSPVPIRPPKPEPKPAPKPAPPPPPPAPPPPPPTPVQAPTLAVAGPDLSAWDALDWDPMQTFSRAPTNRPWVLPAQPDAEVNRVALAVGAGTVLAWWWLRRRRVI